MGITEHKGIHALSLWKGIKHVWVDMISNVGWSLGNGSKVQFWLDNWLGLSSPLISFLLVLFQILKSHVLSINM